jgi:hypothetical protein
MRAFRRADADENVNHNRAARKLCHPTARRPVASYAP